MTGTPSAEEPTGTGPGPQLTLAPVSFVTPRLAFGGDLSPRFSLARRQLQELIDAGITHIIDLREEWSDEQLVALWHPELHYRQHRVDDAGQVIPASWFEGLLEGVREAWQDPDAKVLVHCHMGVNRAPSAVFGLLLAEGWSIPDALTAIRAAREVAVIDYAQDALAWHLKRTAASTDERASAFRALTAWRRAHRLDAEQVIRRIRSRESGSNSWLIVIDRGAAEAAAGLFTGEPLAVWMVVDGEPEELAMLDEVVLWCHDPVTGPLGLVGVGLVVGPVTPRGEDAEPWLPVLLRAFTLQPLLAAAEWPQAAAELGLPTGPATDADSGFEQRLIPTPDSLLAALRARPDTAPRDVGPPC